jgi:hypothetical protein
MDNNHRAPTPFFRASVSPQPRSVVQELYPGLHTEAEAIAQADRLAAAADAFEVINGRLVQVRDPISGAPLPGGPRSTR